ncbi:MAG: hypothetical protein FJZ12_04215 [Candidatus Omnitrophica bacterium]|nr:hypothetical protein [Candidatus Omnitrophota bacterium]
MLKILRNKKIVKKIWVGLGIIILPAFVFWGLGGAMRDKKESRNIGRIPGKEVTALEYRESFLAARNIAIMRYGEDFRQELKDTDLEAMAWQRLALSYEAKKLKITASNKEVVEKIESYPFFKRDGNFDIKLYNELLVYVFRTQPRVFEEQIRQEIIISKLFDRITGNVEISEEELRDGYTKFNLRIDPKFKFEEKKFLAEGEQFRKLLLEEKKEEFFSQYVANLLK